MEQVRHLGVKHHAQETVRHMQHFESEFQNPNLVFKDTDEDLSALSDTLLTEWSHGETHFPGEMNDMAATEMNKSKESKCVSDEELVICLESGDPRFELFAEKYMKFIVLGLDSRVAQSLCEFYKSGAALRDSFEEYWIKMLIKYDPEEIVCLLEDLKGMDLDEVKNLTEHCLKMMKQRGLKPKQCNEQPNTRRRRTQWKSLQSYEKQKEGENKLKVKHSKVATVNKKQLCEKELPSSDQGKVYEGIVLTASRPQAQIGKMGRLLKPHQSTNQSKAVQLSESRPAASFHKPKNDGNSASNKENPAIKEPPKSALEGKAVQLSESRPDGSFHKPKNDGNSASNRENSAIKEPPKSAPEDKAVQLSELRPDASFHKERNDGKSTSNKENSTIKEPPKSALEGKVERGASFKTDNVRRKVKLAYIKLRQPLRDALCNLHRVGKLPADQPLDDVVLMYLCQLSESKALQLLEAYNAQEHVQERIENMSVHFMDFAFNKESSTIKEPPKSTPQGNVERGASFQVDNVLAKVKRVYIKMTQALRDALCNLHRVGKLPADQPLDDIVLTYLCQLSESKALQLLEAYNAQEHVQEREENLSVYFMDFAFKFQKQKSRQMKKI